MNQHKMNRKNNEDKNKNTFTRHCGELLMSTTRELVGWIDGQLHEILGYSEGSVAQFLAALAVKASSARSLHAQILQADLPDNATTRTFSKNLFDRIPKVNAAAQSAAKQAPSHADYLRKSSQYGLVESDDDEDDNDGKASSSSRKSSKDKKKDKRKKHARRRGGHSSDEQEEGGGGEPRDSAVVRGGLGKKSRGGGGGAEEGSAAAAAAKSSEELAEEARERDQVERDEFVERMRNKDDEKTKKFELGGLNAAQVREGLTK
jgi:pre-mRNA-splicing factor ATP-dependent RNA helicase DHX16